MPGTVVVSSHWHATTCRVVLCRSAALPGRRRAVVPSRSSFPDRGAHPEADGAFDLEGIGQGGDLQWPEHLDPNQTVVVDELTPEVADTAEGRVAPRAVLYLSAPGGRHDSAMAETAPHRREGGRFVTVVPRPHPGEPACPTRPSPRLRVHGLPAPPVRHGRQPSDEPPPAAAWVSSAFHDDWVVVVENAVASAWKGRALRGEVPIDTRMDLWRLVAHANACIDLAPGPYIARECVEALRFGTPIVVPEQSGPRCGARPRRRGIDVRGPRRVGRRCGEAADARPTARRRPRPGDTTRMIASATPSSPSRT